VKNVKRETEIKQRKLLKAVEKREEALSLNWV
jgi:hypothetical protein